jgi:hypothetical protein
VKQPSVAARRCHITVTSRRLLEQASGTPILGESVSVISSYAILIVFGVAAVIGNHGRDRTGLSGDGGSQGPSGQPGVVAAG